jgi:hypothetical protein
MQAMDYSKSVNFSLEDYLRAEATVLSERKSLTDDLKRELGCSDLIADLKATSLLAEYYLAML